MSFWSFFISFGVTFGVCAILYIILSILKRRKDKKAQNTEDDKKED